MYGAFNSRQLGVHPNFGIIAFLVLFLVLPQYGAWAMMVGAAGLFSLLVAASPDQFRGPTGSLAMAIGLAVALWVSAAVVVVMTLMGEVR